jgi:hypothetical protein
MDMEWKFFVLEDAVFFINYKDKDKVFSMAELTYVIGGGWDIFDAIRNHLLGNY